MRLKEKAKTVMQMRKNKMVNKTTDFWKEFVTLIHMK